MPTKFNRGKPYHGSVAITAGKLQGATDTDYFYFFCPQCEGKKIMRVLDYGIHEEKSDNPYDSQLKSKSEKGFTIVFKLHCELCSLTDFVKISNLGWQSGDIRTRTPSI